MLKIHQGNQLENLFNVLAAVLARPLKNVMASEYVLVQSQGMARWLSMQLAQKHGICANISCPFPAAFIWRLIEAMTSDSDSAPYQHEAMVWAVYELLLEVESDPDLEVLRSYLSGREPERYFQLATQLACLYDQYMIFRPDWIHTWANGGEDHWQAHFWRKFIQRHGNRHRCVLMDNLLGGMSKELLAAAEVPERLSLFGIPTMPPSLLQIFTRMADLMDVHFFLLNPCAEFWDDLLSEAEIERSRKVLDATALTEEELHFETGNNLLTGFGVLGRDFQRILHNFDFDESSHFFEPGSNTLLTAVQSSILHACPLPASTASLIQDGSIQVHAVHSPMREVEVLHDRLLALFDQEKDLLPGDVLVMVADMERYAPLIEAVFSSEDAAGTVIPFSIADRSIASQNSVMRCFLALTSLHTTRMSGREVLDLLQYAEIRQRFGIDNDDRQVIEQWVRKSGIRWGLHSRHRSTFDVPAKHRGTWHRGVDRMLLGILMPSEGRHTFNGLVPVDDIEGDGAQLFGRFAQFVEQLCWLYEETAKDQSVEAWSAVLYKIIEIFMPLEQIEYFELQTLHGAIEQLEKQAADAGFSAVIPFHTINAFLNRYFDQPAGGSNFLTGKATFCQLVPMRSIPFKVICVLGLNDLDFPRNEHRLGFDLMHAQKRLGDRNRRDDDRYLFLETILSTRQHLYLSFVGMDQRTDKTLPASVVVAELIACIAGPMGIDPAQFEDMFVTRHPLQPFSQRYFEDECGQFSYSQTNLAAARNLDGQSSSHGLFPSGIKWSADVEKEIELDDLVRFFENPLRTLLQNRIGLHYDEYQQEDLERDCFSLNALGRYSLISDFSQTAESVIEADWRRSRAMENNLLPDGRFGQLYIDDISRLRDVYLCRLDIIRGGDPIRPIPVDIATGDLYIRGWLDNLYPGGLIIGRPTSIDKGMKFKDLIGLWIRHLVLNCLHPTNCPSRSTFVGLDAAWTLSPLTEAETLLAGLANLYIQGMQQPLPFLPQSSYAYAVSLWGGKTVDDGSEARAKALQKAQNIWEGNGFNLIPEKANPYYHAVFGDQLPTDWRCEAGLDFHAAASGILSQALMFMEKIKG